MAEVQINPDKKVMLLPGHPVSQHYWKPLSEQYQLAFLYPQAASFADSMGLKTLDLGKFFTPNAQEWANTETARAMGHMQSPSNFGALAANLPDQLNGRLPTWWPGYVLMHMQSLAQRVGAMRELANQYPIAGCVLHEDVAPDTRSMALWCKARGIPTVHVPHATCHLKPDAGPDIHRETRTDWIAAGGEGMARWYAATGFTPERIGIVGAPNFDWLYDDPTTRDTARRVLSLADDDVAVVYATTWAQTTGLRGEWQAEHEAGLAAILALALAWKAKLIIKLHPNDGGNAAGDQALIERMKTAGVAGMVTRSHPQFVLRAADVLIAQGPSNICVEAAIAGTPSAYIQTEGFDYSHPLPFRSDSEGLEQAALMARDSRGDPAWQEFARFYNAAHPDGNAGERVAEFVGRICG